MSETSDASRLISMISIISVPDNATVRFPVTIMINGTPVTQYVDMGLKTFLTRLLETKDSKPV